VALETIVHLTLALEKSARVGTRPHSKILCYFPIVNFLKEIWDFPTHHVALGWWLAAALTLYNVIAQVLSGFLGRVFIWSRRFKASQLQKRIHNVEYLHDNTNGLIRYLALDAVEIAIDFCWLFIVLSVLFARIRPIPLGAALYILSFNAATIVLGRALRIRTLLNDLRDYESRLAKLQTEMLKLGQRK